MPEEVARELKARGRGTQATFGRVVWQLPPLKMIAGPEDKAYDFWTDFQKTNATEFQRKLNVFLKISLKYDHIPLTLLKIPQNLQKKVVSTKLRSNFRKI